MKLHVAEQEVEFIKPRDFTTDMILLRVLGTRHASRFFELSKKKTSLSRPGLFYGKAVGSMPSHCTSDLHFSPVFYQKPNKQISESLICRNTSFLLQLLSNWVRLGFKSTSGRGQTPVKPDIRGNPASVFGSEQGLGLWGSEAQRLRGSEAVRLRVQTAAIKAAARGDRRRRRKLRRLRSILIHFQLLVCLYGFGCTSDRRSISERRPEEEGGSGSILIIKQVSRMNIWCGTTTTVFVCSSSSAKLS